MHRTVWLLTRFRAKLTHKSDGLVFVPLDTGYPAGGAGNSKPPPMLLQWRDPAGCDGAGATLPQAELVKHVTELVPQKT